jgi:hypothetical protein
VGLILIPAPGVCAGLAMWGHGRFPAVRQAPDGLEDLRLPPDLHRVICRLRASPGIVQA